jgi:hypothetical protein
MATAITHREDLTMPQTHPLEPFVDALPIPQRESSTSRSASPSGSRENRLTFAGRFMYHCHILEHEDRDMMRPFVTMPAELMPFM